MKKEKTAIILAIIFAALLMAFSLLNPPEPKPPKKGLEEFVRGGKSVMWIGAHPDDEGVAGSFLVYACKELGNICTIVSLSKGSYGKCQENAPCPCPGKETFCPKEMGEARAKEMLEACSGLNAECLVFDEFSDYKNEGDLAETVKELLETRRPDVVIAFGPGGGSGHKEHVFAHEAVKKAFNEIDSGRRPERLYYSEQFLNIPGGKDSGPVTDEFDATRFSEALGKTYLEEFLYAMEAYKIHKISERISASAQFFEKNLFRLAMEK